MASSDVAETTPPKEEPSAAPFPAAISPCNAWPVDTPGGRFYAEWAQDTPTTREGQLLFFAQFLRAGHRWEDFLRDCPLTYGGNRGSGAANVLGTVMLGILSGHWRYAHLNSVRGDEVNARVLGLDRLVSEDVVRAAMRRIPEEEGLHWLREHLLGSVQPVLDQPSILDIDNTVKCVYGNQQGAEVGYNPHKPGRPSLNYHSYFMANTRICLGVDVRAGKEHSGAKGFEGMWRMLNALPREQWCLPDPRFSPVRYVRPRVGQDYARIRLLTTRMTMHWVPVAMRIPPRVHRSTLQVFRPGRSRHRPSAPRRCAG